MSACPTVHEHPEYKKVFNLKNKEHVAQRKKLKRFLTNAGIYCGDLKKANLSPFRAFPKGNNRFRTLFLGCKECKKEVLAKKCSFCESAEHTMNDAVLFYCGLHNDVYKNGSTAIEKLKK